MIIPIISYGLTGLIAQGDKALWSVIFPFLGTYIGTLATLWGIRYQIAKNEEINESERKEKDKNFTKSVNSYILNCINNNYKKFEIQNGHIEDRIYDNLIELKRNREVHERWLWNFNDDFISNNIEGLFKLSYGSLLLELYDDISYMNSTIIENLKQFNFLKGQIKLVNLYNSLAPQEDDLRNSLDVLIDLVAITRINHISEVKDVEKGMSMWSETVKKIKEMSFMQSYHNMDQQFEMFQQGIGEHTINSYEVQLRIINLVYFQILEMIVIKNEYSKDFTEFGFSVQNEMRNIVKFEKKNIEIFDKLEKLKETVGIFNINS